MRTPLNPPRTFHERVRRLERALKEKERRSFHSLFAHLSDEELERRIAEAEGPMRMGDDDAENPVFVPEDPAARHR